MIEEITEKQRQRCERLEEERYEALRNTIAHLYGQAFLDELEANVDGIISRTRFNDTIQERLGLLRRQYRTKCKTADPYNPIGKTVYRSVYEIFNKKDRKRSEKRAFNQMWLRSKVRKRYNELKRVIAIYLGDEKEKELVWKAAALALADLTNKYKYYGVGMICGVCANDKSYELHHLRILYGYAKWQREGIYGTRIHYQINNNYKNCMLD